jgi:hypothetical protein
VRVGGTFSQPSISIDGEALARAGLQRTLGDVLNRNRGESEDGEATDDNPARSILEGVLGGQRQRQEDSDSETTDSTNDEASVEETVINEGLNALFGRKKKPAEETEKAEENPEQ